jgi:6-phosphogluconolactonase
MLRRNFFISSILFTSSIASAGLAEPCQGHVYAMTNDDDGNSVVVYDRANDGTLTLSELVSTGGDGSGGGHPLEPVDALGSQSPLLMSNDGLWLFAVNAGSNEISVFRVRRSGLQLTAVVPSGGDFPASLTLHEDLLYVLNSGGEGNITGFRLTSSGKLKAINDSTRSLDVDGENPPEFLVSPAQVGFDPSGDFLLLTIKGSNEIRVYPMLPSGRPTTYPVYNESAGTAPFGFDFDAFGHLLVVEPFGSSPPMTGMAGAVSSYELQTDGSLLLISESIPNFQSAACWLTSTEAIPYAFVTNNGMSTVSAYSVNELGELSLVEPSGVSGITGANPVDLAITPNGAYLYTVNAGAGTISMFEVDAGTGALTPLGEVDGLPFHDGAVGIVAR